MFKEFKEFIARGNVIDLAVGVIIGAAFGKIIASLVEGIIMPPIGLALGKIDFASLFIVLDHSKGVPVSLADAKERGHWDDYMKAYEDAFRSTSTKWAPWYIIPADNKWFTHVAIADLIIAKLKSLKLAYPTVSEQHLQELLIAKAALENEP